MKKFISFILLFSIMLFLSCEVEAPQQAKMNIPTSNLLLRKVVAVGNSLTMGIQSAGIVKDFQLHSYPYYIAQQIGMEQLFQQPLIDNPGIGQGVFGPLKFENGQIVPGDSMPADPKTIALNLLLPRPYDNMGVSGADLNDVLHTTSGGLFDLVLRNPNFGNMTQIDQALLLNPSILLLWIGNNDVLGAALSGTAIVGTTITPQNEFETMYGELLAKIKKYSPNTHVVVANIPNVTDIPYVKTLPPVVIDPATFQPVLVGGQPVPLLTKEQDVQYVMLSAFDSLKAGIGIPAALGGTGKSLGGQFTLTADEAATIATAVEGFNNFLASLSLPMVDANHMLSELNDGNIAGFSGDFVYLAPANTAFSLDGVHPNNAGYALVANEFIKVMNQAFGLSIPQLDATQYLGQYAGKAVKKIAPGAMSQVKSIFVK